jgi:uncharacterized membrane protein
MVDMASVVDEVDDDFPDEPVTRATQVSELNSTTGESDGESDDDSPRESIPRWAAFVDRITVPQVLITGIVVAYVVYFTRRTVDIHHALGTASYDSALFDQGLWLLSRFEEPFVTLMGRNLFGDHTSFILLVLVPIYWLWPGAGILFFTQSLAIGLGAIPIFLYGRRRLGSEWLALALSTAYLLHPAVGWTNLENFHPDSVLGVFVGFAIWAALERRWRTYAVFVLLALSVKEDVSLVIVPLGIWVAVKRDRRIGLATIVGSAAFMAFAMLVVIRGLVGVPTRNGWRIPFGGPGGVIETALRDPRALFDHFRRDDRPWYLFQMTAPFAWLFLRRPSVALIGSVVLFTNVLSTFWYQYQIEYHYSLVVVPALALGTIHAIGAVRERSLSVGSVGRRIIRHDSVSTRTAAVAVVSVAAVISSVLWAPFPWSRSPGFAGNPNNVWAEAARDVIELVPDDAVVAAHYRITPHMAYRPEIYQFPVPFRAVLYGPDGLLDGPPIPERAERVEFVVLPVPGAGPATFPAADWAVIESAFEVVESNEYWTLYRRDPNVALPEPPDP